MYCKSCGKQIVDDSRFCSYCGIELNSVEKSQSDLVTKNHICPICSSTEVPILNSDNEQTGTVCMKCDSDIINGKCPNCGEYTANYKDEFCDICGCSWNVSPMVIKKILPADEIYTTPKPFNKVKEEQIKCPNCNSVNLTFNKNGYSAGKAAAGVILTGGVGLLGGFIGSKNIRITCLKCGNSWIAGK